ncbi:DNA-binding protein [Lelliottia sp. JS-SCA-14]|uniref:DNA-binding protein n=1 Tax=Lelliottia sp. JS-SCA-14 TaxID=3110110 RepID=UPI002D778DA1|nr:DNA-binding protein [Lelliottia sp. JS-SCA-14]HDR2795150.1 DNA-binding protein [Enterobacter asburiae]HDR2800490.1 DNA-binding protein [Enterobacter asburiae]
MPKKLKTSVNSAPTAGNLPGDYPFGNRVSESLADYAKRMGVSVGAMRTRADRGMLPILQAAPGKKREVNLYAIYMNARYKGERYTEMMN